MQVQRCFVRYAKQQLVLSLAKNRQYCQTPRRTFLSNEKALRILGLGSGSGGEHVHVDLLTQQQLRKAYLAAAKRCHPDTIVAVAPPSSSVGTATASTTIGRSDVEGVTSDQEHKRQRRAEAGKQFHRVTEAFEALQSRISGSSRWRRSGYWNEREEESTADSSSGACNSYEEEQSFRRACLDVLQVPAHIVEECKRDPGFLQWLQGNTDAAYTWRNFLHQHGGLAPVLSTSDAKQPSLLPLKGGGPVRRSRRR
jgi:hypothetical protein